MLLYNRFLSKSLLYGKLNKTEIDTLLPNILDKYFEKYLTYFLKKPVDRYYIEEKHREYNKYRKNIESIFIINKYFERDWCNRLIVEYYI